MMVERLGHIRRSFHEPLQEVYPKASRGKVVVAVYSDGAVRRQAWKLTFALSLGYDTYACS